MMSHFRLIYCVMWTASLTYVTNGAPTEAPSMLDTFLMNFGKCQVLEYVALPTFKLDNDASRSNPDSEVNYDMSIPLETCATTPEEDSTAVPICYEAFEMMRNLSTCRDDINVLKETIPSSFKTISIAAEVDNVCKEFSSSQSILAQKENYVAYKFADPVICPLVCREKVVKACAFLLWGYKVQAKINDALHTSVVPHQSAPVVQNHYAPVQDQDAPGQDQDAPVVHIQGANQNAKDTVGVGNPDVASQNQQPVDNTLAQKAPDHAELGERRKSMSLTVPETSDISPQSSLVNNKPQLNEPEHEKNILKTSEISKGKSEVPESPETESGKPVVPEDVVPPKTQTNDKRLLVKTSVSSTTVAGRSATVSLTGTSENGKGEHVLNGHSKDSPDVKSKTSTAASSANSEPHKSNPVNTEAKLHSDETNKEIDSNNPNLGKESKGKGTLQSGSSIPGKDSVDKSMPDTSKVTPGDQEYIGNTDSQDSSVKGSVENGNKNEDDPPPDTGNKSKLDTPVTDKKNPKDSANEKPVFGTVTKETKLTPEDSASEGILGTSDAVGSKYQPEEEADKDLDGQFDGESSDDGLNDGQFDGENSDDGLNDFDQPLAVNGNALPDPTKPKSEDDMAKKAEKHKSEANFEANKPPVKINGGFPEQEDTHFFFYFVTIVIFAIGGYVLFHNKQKIFALIIEGRHERRRRSGASYRKLETK